MGPPHLHLVLTHDLPVCFPGRPCQYFSPLEADAINLTSALTPISGAVAVAVLGVLAAGLALALLGLARLRAARGPSPWLVVLSMTLFVLGVVASSAVSIRFDAISLIYGPEGPPGAALVASWPLVRVAGDATALVGLLILAATASIATVRLRALRRPE